MTAPETIPIRDTSGLLGFVAVDSVVRGMASGGLRMRPDVTGAELALLARTMTLKYGFLGMPKGGAKGGIRFDPEGDPVEVKSVLCRFGRAIRPLIESGRYMPGPDMGVDNGRLRYLLEESGATIRAGALWPFSLQGDFTAAGVVESFGRSARWLGIPAAGRTASIEGLGAVGLNVARRLAAQGVRITAVATRHGAIGVEEGIDPARWVSFIEEHGESAVGSFPGAERLDRGEFLSRRVSAFIPCARHHTVTPADASRLGTKLIVAGANNPLSSDAREAAERAGIAVLPDFVTNAGGVLGGAIAHGGVDPRVVPSLVEPIIGAAIDSLLRTADRSGGSVYDLGVEAALSRFEGMRASRTSPLFLLGLALHRRGLVPGAMTRLFARAFVVRTRRAAASFGRPVRRGTI